MYMFPLADQTPGPNGLTFFGHSWDLKKVYFGFQELILVTQKGFKQA